MRAGDATASLTVNCLSIWSGARCMLGVRLDLAEPWREGAPVQAFSFFLGEGPT